MKWTVSLFLQFSCNLEKILCWKSHKSWESKLDVLDLGICTLLTVQPALCKREHLIGHVMLFKLLLDCCLACIAGQTSLAWLVCERLYRQLCSLMGIRNLFDCWTVLFNIPVDALNLIRKIEQIFFSPVKFSCSKKSVVSVHGEFSVEKSDQASVSCILFIKSCSQVLLESVRFFCWFLNRIMNFGQECFNFWSISDYISNSDQEVPVLHFQQIF